MLIHFDVVIDSCFSGVNAAGGPRKSSINYSVTRKIFDKTIEKFRK
uniref:Uncharacterized protein n=1 Tax=Candidatus Kentrum sp. LFY TaxID=2126342 RepID=A0A450X780_9GAMM|nr:MAG: hypothetical protein BECKLFY1418C_GA0070996_12183 [Candidatus Kentron sp. LFY]